MFLRFRPKPCWSWFRRVVRPVPSPQGLKLTVYALAPKMRHHTYTARTLWTYARLFLFQFVNTGLVVLIVSGGLPNAAMEYLEGEELADTVKREGPIPLARLMPLLDQVLDMA